MEFKTVIYGARDGMAKIVINRAERMNGYNETMVKEMCAAIDLARQDDDVRVLIITGSGRAFCAGGDISGAPESRSRFHGHPMGHMLEMREGFHQLVISLHRFDKPVIAAINGAAVAGGLTLALVVRFQNRVGPGAAGRHCAQVRAAVRRRRGVPVSALHGTGPRAQDDAAVGSL